MYRLLGLKSKLDLKITARDAVSGLSLQIQRDMTVLAVIFWEGSVKRIITQPFVLQIKEYLFVLIFLISNRFHQKLKTE